MSGGDFIPRTTWRLFTHFFLKTPLIASRDHRPCPEFDCHNITLRGDTDTMRCFTYESMRERNQQDGKMHKIQTKNETMRAWRAEATAESLSFRSLVRSFLGLLVGLSGERERTWHARYSQNSPPFVWCLSPSPSPFPGPSSVYLLLLWVWQ